MKKHDENRIKVTKKVRKLLNESHAYDKILTMLLEFYRGMF